ncbi:hypothetical protein TNCV_3943911 [Trichonephila clavipes]|nr:hypothetical protein TNCV_3943911 [Trichonephila clavipes]
MVEECHERTAGLSMCHGLILGVAVYRKIEAFTTCPPHTHTIVITAQVESSFVAEDDLVPFVADQSRRARHHLKRRRKGEGTLTARVMGAVIPDILQPYTLRWFGKTQGPVVKVLKVSGQQPMRKLALCERVICEVFSTTGLSRMY